LYDTWVEYSVLRYTGMDGIAEHRNKMMTICEMIPKRKYDPLETKNLLFDEDFTYFIEELKDAKTKLGSFLVQAVDEQPSMECLIAFVRR
jgi:hypothetical protein